jgi:hypothetical protein
MGSTAVLRDFVRFGFGEEAMAAAGVAITG